MVEVDSVNRYLAGGFIEIGSISRPGRRFKAGFHFSLIIFHYIFISVFFSPYFFRLFFLLPATRKKFHFVKQKNGQARILLGCQKDLTCHVFPRGWRGWGRWRRVLKYRTVTHTVTDIVNFVGLALSQFLIWLFLALPLSLGHPGCVLPPAWTFRKEEKSFTVTHKIHKIVTK